MEYTSFRTINHSIAFQEMVEIFIEPGVYHYARH